LRKGKIYFHSYFTGVLQETDDGYVFQYDNTYLNSEFAVPIGINYPLQKEPYFTKTIPPYFDGLIPEGWFLNYITKNWKIDPRDRMSLLLKVCKDCIGAVSVIEEEAI
jgi:serine/threonine-protein kinase HipA